MKIIILLLYLYYIIQRSNRSIHMLQQNKYNAHKTYIKWLIREPKRNFITTDLLYLISIIFIFIKNINLVYIIFLILTLVLIIIENKTQNTDQNKLPLKYTSRVKRLIITNSVLYLILIIVAYKINTNITYTILGILGYLNNILILLPVLINTPIEKLVSLHYLNNAKRKLKNMPNLKVVGITGSYGKTSSKNILNDILNVKFNSLESPKNYNTPNGIMITINNYLDKYNDVFIAEMGACQPGDIKELCDLVHPKYGIITKIGVAHLQTFHTRENIQKTKFELAESLPDDGVIVLNKDDEWQRSYKIKKSKCKVVWIGINNKDADIIAEDIKMTKDGSTFNIKFKEDNTKYKFETKLLGFNNIYNILAGVALGKEFNMTVEELKAGVLRVKPVEHRLELKKQGDLNIIDDAYNSNPVGAKMALDVLKLMPGKHIVVTPGMIELGDKEYELNKQFGKQMKDVADEVILVGKEKTKPIYEGLKEINFKEENIHIINDVLKAFPLMQKLKEGETYVLLENDLPDIFNEK